MADKSERRVVAVDRDRFDRWVWWNASLVQLWTMVGWAVGGLAGGITFGLWLGKMAAVCWAGGWLVFVGPLAWYLLFWAYTTEEPEDEVNRDNQE